VQLHNVKLIQVEKYCKRRNLKGIKRLLVLGSVSRKIFENVFCSILMIDREKK